MADVTLVAIPSQVQNVAAAGGQQGQPPVQNNPPAGTLVSGTIAGKDANGNYLLKSSLGTFTLQSSTPLTYNSDVTIRIGANTAAGSNARIVTVNGEPFSEFSAPEPETSDSVSPSLLTPASQTPQASSPAATILRAVVLSAPVSQTPVAFSQGSAVVVRLAQPPAGTQTGEPEPQTPAPQQAPAASVTGSAAVTAEPQQQAQNPQLAVAASPAPAPAQPASVTPAATPATAAPVETELAPAETVTQVAQVQTPQAETQQPQPAPQQIQSAPQQAQPVVQQVQTAAPQQAPTAPQQPQQPATPPAPVTALYNVYAKQSASAVPLSAATPSTPAAQSAPIPAQVTSADENGTLTLQTLLGNVTVKASSLPGLFTAGAAVTIEPAAAAPAEATTPATLPELASSWQSLKDIASVVSTTSPATANTLLARLPQIGANFLSTSTSFIAALLQGDIRKLLGDDTLDTLRDNGRQDLIERFSGELASLSSSFSQPQARQVAGWQMLFLPFVYQEALQQARIYVKREPPKKDRASAKNTADTRFVVEVDLSELGPLQMDGLVRKKEQATAFDLVIRSHQPFTPEQQAEISGIYAGTAELTGFKGSLAFQVTRDFAVKPLDEAAGEKTHAITV